MKIYIFLVAILAATSLTVSFVALDTHNSLQLEKQKLEVARLEWKNKLLELDHARDVDFYAAGYEPYICEDKRCWIKKEL